MNHRLLRTCVLSLSSLAFAAGLLAQTPPPAVAFPDASPKSTLKQRVGLTDIEIAYSRPSVKGRKIFGGLEPYGEVWRAGANNATTITFSTPVKFGGKDVAAGTYALFAKLGEQSWELILTTGVKQWGAYSYDPKDEVVRTTAKVTQLAENIETFLIDINHIRDDSAILNLVWENTVASVKLEFDVVSIVKPQIEAVMASDAKTKPYFPSAMFYLDHNLDLKQAVAWMDAAIAARPTAYFMIYRKAKIQAAAGDTAGARASIAQSLELAKKDKPGPLQDEYVRLNEALLATLK